MDEVATRHIELRSNLDGQPRAFIAGTRVRVQGIYFAAEIENKSPDEIVTALPHLTLSQVHAALSYYFDHRDEILAEIREDNDFVEEMRQQIGPGPLDRKRTGAADSHDHPISSG